MDSAAVDETEFATKYRQYQSNLWSIVRHYFPPSGQDWNDLQQIALIGFWKATQTWDPERSAFHSFLITCVRGEIFSYIKYHSRLKRQHDNHHLIAPETLQEIISGEEDFYPSHITFPDLTRLERLVASLRHQGYTYAEIADKANIEWKAVDNAIQRIKRKWRKLINEQ